MNWKVYGRKQSWPNLDITLIFHEGNEEKHEEPQSELAVSGPIFEPGTCAIRRTFNHHSTANFFAPVISQRTDNFPMSLH
jgi:hypothetical protein